MTRPASLFKNGAAAVGAEFALIVSLLVLFLVGIVDAGRIMWTWNRAEKATHMGARFAAVTQMADAVEDPANPGSNSGFWTYDFYTLAGVPRGDPIPQSLFGGATCTSTGCTCNAGATCPPFGPISSGFTNTVARMQAIMPEIQPQNVTIEYGYSGLGYSGDPYGSDVNPLITIRLVDMAFTPALGQVFGFSINLPAFAATMSMEDGTGTISN
jgi:hypothetical protein